MSILIEGTIALIIITEFNKRAKQIKKAKESYNKELGQIKLKYSEKISHIHNIITSALDDDDDIVINKLGLSKEFLNHIKHNNFKFYYTCGDYNRCLNLIPGTRFEVNCGNYVAIVDKNKVKDFFPHLEIDKSYLKGNNYIIPPNSYRIVYANDGTHSILVGILNWETFFSSSNPTLTHYVTGLFVRELEFNTGPFGKPAKDYNAIFNKHATSLSIIMACSVIPFTLIP